MAAIYQSFPPQHRSSAVLRIATPKPHLKCYVALHKQTAVVQMSVWSSHKFYSQANEGGHTVLKQENSGQLQNRHQEQFNFPPGWEGQPEDRDNVLVPRGQRVNWLASPFRATLGGLLSLQQPALVQIHLPQPLSVQAHFQAKGVYTT